MRQIIVVKISTNTNTLVAMEAFGQVFTWNLNTETLPQYIHDFIKNAKVECFGNLVTYR